MISESDLKKLVCFAENVVLKEPRLVDKLNVCQIINTVDHSIGFLSSGIILDTIPCIPSEKVWSTLVEEEILSCMNFLGSLNSPNERHQSSASSKAHSNYKLSEDGVGQSNENDDMMIALHYAVEYASFPIEKPLTSKVNCGVQLSPLNLFPFDTSESDCQSFTKKSSPTQSRISEDRLGRGQQTQHQPNHTDKTQLDLKSVNVNTVGDFPFYTCSSQLCIQASQLPCSCSIVLEEGLSMVQLVVSDFHPHLEISATPVTSDSEVNRLNAFLKDASDPLLLSRWSALLWTRTHIYNLPCPQSLCSIISERDSVVVLLVQATFRVAQNLALTAALSLSDALGKPLIALVSRLILLSTTRHT